jgi:hypothetical protein
MDKNFLRNMEYDSGDLIFTVSRSDFAAEVTYNVILGERLASGMAVSYRTERRTSSDAEIQHVRVGALSVETAFTQAHTFPKLQYFLSEEEIFSRLESLYE